MLLPFFKLAAVAPERQRAFRYMAVTHILFALIGAGIVVNTQPSGTPLVGPLMLILGIVEGALLIGCA